MSRPQPEPSTSRKLGIDEPARERNPSVIYALGSGLWPAVPPAGDLAQDMTGMARGHAVHHVACRGGRLSRFAPPGAMNDVITGTYLFPGILAALLRRCRARKRGETVTGSLLQSALFNADPLVGSAANTVGASTSARPRPQPRSALVNQYQAEVQGRLDRRRRHQRARVDAFVARADRALVADPLFAATPPCRARVEMRSPRLDNQLRARPAFYVAAPATAHWRLFLPVHHVRGWVLDDSTSPPPLPDDAR